MKLATTCPFMEIRRQYCTSNLLNSITYKAIHPMASGLLIALHRDLSVRTTTMWAWKYGLRAPVTKAKISFFIEGTSPLGLGVIR